MIVRATRVARLGAVPGEARPGRPAPPAVAQVVTQVASALRSGAPVEAAWSRWGVGTVDGLPRPADLVDRVGATAAQARAVVAAARCAVEVGAAQAGVLDRVAGALGDQAQAQAARRAVLAGPRATARLLGWLPAVGLVLGAGLGARPWEVLLDGGVGTALGLVGVVLVVVGRRWVAALVRHAESAGADT